MKKLLSAILIVISFFVNYSCDSTDPTDDRIISLEAVDASCTEAWLNVALQNVALPAKTILTRNDSLVGEYNLFSADTVIIDEGLNPSTDYSFKLSLANGGTNSVTSIRTMDTTSHSFTWQTWELGEHSSSISHDAVIINDNKIWITTDIYLNDSLGQPDPHSFNLIKWENNNINISRINMLSSCNPVTYPPLKAIWSFAMDSIVVTTGGSINWITSMNNNLDCTLLPFLNGTINKFWGSSSSNLICVGNSGTIARYNGNTWSKIESGTNQMISDIWGLDENFILAAASHPYSSGDKKIIQINKNYSNDFNWEPQKRVSTVYFNNKHKIYAGGDGIWVFKNNNWKKVEGLPSFYVFRIRGSGHNDIWAAGGFGEVAHFNGSTWTTFDQLKLNSGNYYSVSVTKNKVCLMGRDGAKAVIKINRR